MGDVILPLYDVIYRGEKREPLYWTHTYPYHWTYHHYITDIDYYFPGTALYTPEFVKIVPRGKNKHFSVFIILIYILDRKT